MPKNKALEYQSNEPAFLQRLRAAQVGTDGRHERPVPRPTRTRANDEDDAPTYVVDDGTNETMSKSDYEHLLARSSAADRVDDGTTPGVGGQSELGDVGGQNKLGDKSMVMSGALPVISNGDVARPGKTKPVSVGRRKRKAATVIGQETDEGDEETSSMKTAKTKKRNKSRAIRLSFDDD